MSPTPNRSNLVLLCMHEAARNGGAIPSQVNEAPRAPTRRKAFAVLPDKAPQILVDDTSYVRSPELSWPHRCLDNRRVFQALLHRCEKSMNKVYHLNDDLTHIDTVGKYYMAARTPNVRHRLVSPIRKEYLRSRFDASQYSARAHWQPS